MVIKLRFQIKKLMDNVDANPHVSCEKMELSFNVPLLALLFDLVCYPLPLKLCVLGYPSTKKKYSDSDINERMAL